MTTNYLDVLQQVWYQPKTLGYSIESEYKKMDQKHFR